jgi:hypothetical protein
MAVEVVEEAARPGFARELAARPDLLRALGRSVWS